MSRPPSSLRPSSSSSPANMLKIGYGVLLAVVGAGADDGSVVAAEMSGTD